MSRLIDADALLAKFNKKSDLWTALTDEKTANDFALYCKVADAIEDTPTIGGWISVKDRLPEVDKSILYCAFGRSVGEGVYRGFDGRHHVWNMYAVSGTHWDNEVTHWMQLPEPPKTEK